MRPQVLACALVLVGVALLYSGGRFYSVHDNYGEWAWSPSSAPPKVQFQGNEYDRSGGIGDLQIPGSGSIALPPGWVPSGHVAGQVVYARLGVRDMTAQFFYLHSKGRFVGYGCGCGGD